MSDTPKKPKSERKLFRGFLDVMSEMHRSESRWLQRRDSGTGGMQQGQGRDEATAYVPPADIFALGDDLIVRCEIAGVRYADVSISVSNSVLTISGHRSSELDEDKVVYYTRERVYGEFRRSMILPEGCDQNDVSATVRDGMLEITIRNAATSRLHNVQIQDSNDEGGGRAL